MHLRMTDSIGWSSDTINGFNFNQFVVYNHSPTFRASQPASLSHVNYNPNI
jgi:hypothetical protein